MNPPDRAAPRRLPFALRALRHPNYRLFFFGQGASLIGTWMQHMAMQWLVFRLTGSEVMLGVVSFAGQIPNLLFAPVAGVFADRWDRRRLLLVTQTLSMLQAAALAALMFSGQIRTPSDAWILVVMSLFLGLVNSVDIPVRQSFVVEMVGSREELAGAIPLNSFLVNSSRFIGPSVAGLLVAWAARYAGDDAGEGSCFLVNALTYLGVLGALLAMRLTPRERTAPARRLGRELSDGLAYAWRTPHIRLILLFLASVSLAGIPYMTLMAVFAKEVFGGDARLQGWLMGAVGLGAIAGTFMLASRRSSAGLGRAMARGALVFGSGLMLFAALAFLWPRLWPALYAGRAAPPVWAVLPLAVPLLMAVGFGQVSQLTAGNTLLQTLVDEDKRGRVMSLHTVAFLGVAPLGSLAAGAIARHLGAPATVLIGGAACLTGALLFSARLRALREHFAETGGAGREGAT
ncbi:MAG TPA: MFS transporter [Planctomycetota bacterium]|nr:MFS transporter [Planctomycetota bacterium]